MAGGVKEKSYPCHSVALGIHTFPTVRGTLPAGSTSRLGWTGRSQRDLIASILAPVGTDAAKAFPASAIC